MFKSIITGYTMFKDPAALGAWQQFFDPIHINQDHFYKLLAETIRYNQFQKSKISVIRKSEGWFRANRKYLRVEFKGYFFDVFFTTQEYNSLVLWRLFKKSNRSLEIISAFSETGKSIAKAIHEKNRTEADSVLIFKENIHQCILAVVDQLRWI